ncbi:MAG: CsbD family protein [Candidatus Thermoplasmatota archaeon]|jgi:uncharacterized protein YjbJ (UPF0337 family)
MGEHTNKAMGKARQAFGRATGNRDLERQGKVQEATGNVQGGVRKAAGSVSNALDKISAKMGQERRVREESRRDPKT